MNWQLKRVDPELNGSTIVVEFKTVELAVVIDHFQCFLRGCGYDVPNNIIVTFED